MSEKIKEVILCKYGEVILKGANRSEFEAKMIKELKRRAKRFGNFKIHYAQSTVFCEPLDEDSAEMMDEMTEQAKAELYKAQAAKCRAEANKGGKQ